MVPYALGALFAVFIGAQLVFWLKTWQLVGREAPDLSPLLGGKPLLPGSRAVVYFFSSRCPACSVMGPRVDRLAEEHPNVVKVDVPHSRALADQFGVTLTPTVMVVEEGRVTRVLVGLQSQRRLARLLT
jgi:thioredoxin 1